MLLLFLAFLAFALAVSALLFRDLSEGLRNLAKRERDGQSLRVIILFVLCLGGWGLTVPSLVAQNAITSSYSSYSITLPSGTVSVQASSATSAFNSPFPISTFWLWLTFVSAINGMVFLLFIMYLLKVFALKSWVAVHSDDTDWV